MLASLVNQNQVHGSVVWDDETTDDVGMINNETTTTDLTEKEYTSLVHLVQSKAA
jgi:hypothetical protein